MMPSAVELVETPVVEPVETRRRLLRASPSRPPRDARPSRARRERMPAQLRVSGAASRIRDSAAWRFSEVIPRRLMVCSRRFWMAPRFARLVVTLEIAASRDAMAAVAEAAEDTAMPEMPRSLVETVPIVNAMFWLALAPTCRVTAVPAVATEPARIFRPLNSVSVPVLPISVMIC